MNYDKNGFLAGISVGRTLKGWSGGSTSGPVKITWSKICGGDFSTTSQNRIIAIGWACGVYFVVQENPNIAFASVDGVTWTSNPIQLPSGDSLSTFYAFGNGIFAIATTQGKCATTKNFKMWDVIQIPNYDNGNIYYQSGRFFLVTRGGDTSYIVSTADFESFETVSRSGNIGSDNTPTEAGFAGRNDHTAYLTTRGGGSVSSVSLPGSYPYSAVAGAIGNCVFACQNSSGNITLYSTVDGITWVSTPTNVSSESYIILNYPGDGRLWTKGDNYKYAVTSDLINVEDVTLPGTLRAYFRGIYFVGSDQIQTSKDLVSFTPFPYLQTSDSVLTSGSAVFVSSGNDLGSTAFMSLDGNNWAELDFVPSAVFEKNGVILAYESLIDRSSGIPYARRYTAYVGTV